MFTKGVNSILGGVDFSPFCLLLWAVAKPEVRTTIINNQRGRGHVLMKNVILKQFLTRQFVRLFKKASFSFGGKSFSDLQEEEEETFED